MSKLYDFQDFEDPIIRRISNISCSSLGLAASLYWILSASESESAGANINTLSAIFLSIGLLQSIPKLVSKFTGRALFALDVNADILTLVLACFAEYVIQIDESGFDNYQLALKGTFFILAGFILMAQVMKMILVLLLKARQIESLQVASTVMDGSSDTSM